MQGVSVFDPYDLPTELYVKPLALIATAGLDSVNNAVHKTIWDALSSNRRPDRVPIQFKLLSNAHEFPVLKPQRSSYEWYIPKGILKCNWMNKHLNELPAVIVLFYDLDWSDPQWNEKLIECSSRVQSMRAAVEGRNTRIAVVLIQQTPPMPASEDIFASERAAALCMCCGLNSKCLFVLPLGDHLHGYTARLENAFYELAQSYYQHEIRNIKSHRDHLNKTTHQYLFVRHQFKMGFLSEFKQDLQTAHKHYTHAYNNLQEIRIVDTNAMEIRTIAGFINYKLCKLTFALNLPRDAISQFRTHVDYFKQRAGFKELAFEHYAWLSKQFSLFGELFDEAIRLGLPAVQTQHPGFYYQQAAYYATLRKKTCLEICPVNSPYPNPDPLDGENKLEHYGQRPWRPGRRSAEPPDPALEMAAINALQWKERHNVNHSSIIIALYGNAISQFKTYRCPRMKRALVVQMADECFWSNDHGKALTLLSHMLWDYRSEKWYSIIAPLLQRAVCCAFLTGNVKDYILFSIETLANSIVLPNDYKIEVLDNLLKVLKKKTPGAPKSISEAAVKSANHLWSIENSKNDPNPITIEMNNITLFFQAKARFTSKEFPVHEEIFVEILLRSNCCQKMSFSKALIAINSPNYSKEIEIAEGKMINGLKNPKLEFEKNECKKFFVNFKPSMEDAGKELFISGISLWFGTASSNERGVMLKFNGLGNELFTAESTHHEFQCLQNSPKNMPNFYDIVARTSAQIVLRPSNLSIHINHEPPILTGEWYPIDISLKNEENKSVNSIVVEINATHDMNEKTVLVEVAQKIGQATPLPLIINFSKIQEQSSEIVSLFIRSNSPGNVLFSIKITYFINLTNDQLCPCLKQNDSIINCTNTWEIDCQYLTPLMEETKKCFLNENFSCCPLVKNISTWPITIEKTELQTSDTIKLLSNLNSDNENVLLKSEDSYSDIFLIRLIKASGNQTAIGQYSVYWKRKDVATPMNVTTFALPVINAEVALFKIDLKIVSQATVHQPISAVYRLYNNSDELMQLDICMDASDAFMFAGHKQKQISILPDSYLELKYILYPLVLGRVSIPKLRLVISKTLSTSINQNHINEIVERSIVSMIFVLPKAKGDYSDWF